MVLAAHDLAPESHHALRSAGRMELRPGDTPAATLLEAASRANLVKRARHTCGQPEQGGPLGNLIWLRGERERSELIVRAWTVDAAATGGVGHDPQAA